MRNRLFIILATLFFATSAFAQQAAKNQQYIWNDWAGGLNSKGSVYSLPKNQGQICENVRLGDELHSLTKREKVVAYGTADTTEAITGMHRLYLKDGTKILIVNHGDEIETGNDNTGAFTKILDLSTGDYKWQWLTWHDIAIGMDGYNNPVKYDGSSSSATYLGSCLGTDAGSGAGPNGTYTYKIAFYTSTYTVNFNIPSNAVTVVDNDINLTMIPIAPDTFFGEDVIGRKVYRIANGGTTYKLLTNGTIADNTTTTLTDSDADAALGASYSTVDNSTVFSCQPPKGRFPIINNNRLFIANDPSYPSRIYYSEDACPGVFYADSYFEIRPDDGDQITFVKNLLGVLTISKNNTIQKLYTDGATPSDDWSISDPFSFIGCQAPYSAVNSPLGVIYLSRGGLYVFNGQASTLISDQVTPDILDISDSNFLNCWGDFANNIYYLAYTSKATGSSTNNRVLVLDIITKSYVKDLLDIACFCLFNSGTDTNGLYYGSSTDGKVYSYFTTIHEILQTRQSDFSGTFTSARYIPTRWGGVAESPVIEIARTTTIDTMTGTIDEQTGTIDRDVVSGEYVSQVFPLTADSFDKIYWNETIPAAGGNVTFQFRESDTSASCETADWSTEVTNPAGSDISSISPEGYFQYRMNLSTDDMAYTPTVYDNGQYAVRITYNTQGTSGDTTIPLHWRSGWTDLGQPGYKKVLRKIECYYTGTEGTLNLLFTSDTGDTNNFAIDLAVNPNYYTAYFNNGALLGTEFTLDISNSDLNALKIRKIICVYDVEPMV